MTVNINKVLSADAARILNGLNMLPQFTPGLIRDQLQIQFFDKPVLLLYRRSGVPKTEIESSSDLSFRRHTLCFPAFLGGSNSINPY